MDSTQTDTEPAPESKAVIYYTFGWEASPCSASGPHPIRDTEPERPDGLEEMLLVNEVTVETAIKQHLDNLGACV